MRHIAEAARTTPVMHETEVLVVGGGPGGLAAALAAARAGAATTLVDRYGCFGGVITQVGVDTLAWYRHEATVEAGGIGVEFERRAEQMGGTAAGRAVAQPGARLRALQGRRRPARAGGRRRAAPALPRHRAGGRGRPRQGRRRREQVRPPGDPRRARRRRHRRRRPGVPRGGAVPHAPARLGDGRQRHVLLLRRGQGTLPRPRRGERADLRRLGQVLERPDHGQGGRPLQPLSAGAVRPGARQTESSPRTSAASAAPGAASRTRARRLRSTWWSWPGTTAPTSAT